MSVWVCVWLRAFGDSQPHCALQFGAGPVTTDRNPDCGHTKRQLPHHSQGCVCRCEGGEPWELGLQVPCSALVHRLISVHTHAHASAHTIPCMWAMWIPCTARLSTLPATLTGCGASGCMRAGWGVTTCFGVYSHMGGVVIHQAAIGGTRRGLSLWASAVSPTCSPPLPAPQASGHLD